MYIGHHMILTTLQIQHLHKKSHQELLKIYKNFKAHTKKQSKKEELVKEINTLIQLLNTFRQELGQELKSPVKTFVKTNTQDYDAVDLRQIHASFRQALQCSHTNKANIIQAILKLSKQVNFFIHY